ncbi:MAG: ISKra4 family transposase, partial [Acidimicrobiales bacterium]
MKVTVSVVIEADGQAPTLVRDVFSMERGALSPDTLGLRLDEANGLLSAVQEAVVDQQVNLALATQSACPDCGEDRRHKDTRGIVVRSLYGTLHLRSPRWWHCNCRPHDTRTFSPLAALFPERTTPELAYLEAKFSGLAAYGASAKLLGEVLPLGRRLHATTLSRQAQAVAERLEDELGDERWSFIDTCQRDRDALPRPDMPLVVSLDGGYVHSAEQRSRRDGWFEVIAGRATPVEGPSKCFG